MATRKVATPSDETYSRFKDNLKRVETLVQIYTFVAGGGQGRRRVNMGDLLRAAVVFLHASLEEYIRELIQERLPDASAESLDDVPLVGISNHGRPEKSFLGKLVPHRTKSVQEVLDESVGAFSNTLTVNNSGDLAALLRRISLQPDQLNSQFASLDELMSRRHHIVHQADLNEQTGLGHHRARSIGTGKVNEWITSVRNFVVAVQAALGRPAS